MKPIREASDRAECLEQACREDKERRLLEAELRKQARRVELPGYDSRLRHDTRFPDSVVEEAGFGTQNDRLSSNGDEPPVR